MGNRGRKGQPDGGRRIGWNPGSYRGERRAAHTRTDEALTCPGANRRAAAETLGFAVDSSRGLASGDESISDLNRKNPGEPDHPCRCRVNVQADAISSQATQAIHELVGTHARMFSARLQAHRQQLFPPTGRKTLRKFTSGEAARLIGTDDGVLRRLSLSGKGPAIDIASNGRRSYSAEDIQGVRIYLDAHSKGDKRYLPPTQRRREAASDHGRQLQERQRQDDHHDASRATPRTAKLPNTADARSGARGRSRAWCERRRTDATTYCTRRRRRLRARPR